MDIVRISILTLVAAFLLSFLRKEKSSIVMPATALFCVVIFKYALTNFGYELKLPENIIKNVPLSEYTQPLLKIFGVSLLTETTVDICRQAGENAIASKLEFVSKIEMIILCFPLIEQILEIIKTLILF